MLTKSQKWVFDCFRLALQRHPELRVGQLIVNALDGKYSGGLFSLSDGQFGRLLLDYRPERIPW